jgi:hypothetical protein
VATPNYGYERRQKELAKKKKKEDKLKAKADRKLGIPAGGDNSSDGLDESQPGEPPPSLPSQT